MIYYTIIKIQEGFSFDMVDSNNVEKKFSHTCYRCGGYWESVVEKPQCCAKCRSKVWDKSDIPKIEIYVPIPKFNHEEEKSLPFIGSKCPYCKGTTGIDSVGMVQFCYSCDFCWNLQGIPLGVKIGIGVR
jgi:hypothetical protein